MKNKLKTSVGLVLLTGLVFASGTPIGFTDPDPGKNAEDAMSKMNRDNLKLQQAVGKEQAAAEYDEAWEKAVKDANQKSVEADKKFAEANDKALAADAKAKESNSGADKQAALQAQKDFEDAKSIAQEAKDKIDEATRNREAASDEYEKAKEEKEKARKAAEAAVKAAKKSVKSVNPPVKRKILQQKIDSVEEAVDRARPKGPELGGLLGHWLQGHGQGGSLENLANASTSSANGASPQNCGK